MHRRLGDIIVTRSVSPKSVFRRAPPREIYIHDMTCSSRQQASASSVGTAVEVDADGVVHAYVVMRGLEKAASGVKQSATATGHSTNFTTIMRNRSYRGLF